MTVTIGRRGLLVALGGAAAWPLAARAQQAERMRRIGVLLPAAVNDAEFQARIGAFRQGLQEGGWSIGRNVQLDIRWATGRCGQDSPADDGVGRARAGCDPGE